MLRLILAITAALLIAAGNGLSQQPVRLALSSEKPNGERRTKSEVEEVAR